MPLLKYLLTRFGNCERDGCMLFGDMPESSREIALRHVAQGRQIVESQRQLIDHLKSLGRPTVDAERVLYVYESGLRIFEDDLARIIANDETTSGA